eukprot:TRINITY_DN13540_c0_g1_i1.p1 TRINITY_DN13540_c0_g1~~TRINITY_DN13540_c0_g1_i1.p1  ORF type:complete len:535 (+),score=117.07 TRINITY_DN13540_c0_g1_i1:47-1606(+)
MATAHAWPEGGRRLGSAEEQSGARGGSSEAQWACSRCTLLNSPGNDTCEVCDAPRAAAPAAPPAKRQRTEPSKPASSGRAAAAADTPVAAVGKVGTPAGGLWFTGHGFMSNAPRSARHTISFAELLLGPNGEKPTALLVSTYMLDPRFLRDQVPRGVPCTVVRHWKVGVEDPERKQIGSDWIIHHPPLQKMQTMHTKLVLAVYSGSVRVAVTSANLTAGDWQSCSQCVWAQDFPARGSPPVVPAEKTDLGADFQRELGRVLKSFGAMDPGFLSGYDFSAANAELVASFPGEYHGEQADSCGYRRLAAILQRRGLRHNRWPIHFAASSIGFLSYPWYNAVASSLIGGTKVRDEEGKWPLRVVYPSDDSVRRSRQSMLGGGVISLSSTAYEKDYFPKGMLREYVGTHPTMGECSSHAKVMMQWPEGAEEESPGNFGGWTMVGSHNFSPSALGKPLQPEGVRFNNYELSVFLPPPKSPVSCDFRVMEASPGMPTHPTTFLVPAPKYAVGQRPWMDFGGCGEG